MIVSRCAGVAAPPKTLSRNSHCVDDAVFELVIVPVACGVAVFAPDAVLLAPLDTLAADVAVVEGDTVAAGVHTVLTDGVTERAAEREGVKETDPVTDTDEEMDAEADALEDDEGVMVPVDVLLLVRVCVGTAEFDRVAVTGGVDERVEDGVDAGVADTEADEDAVLEEDAVYDPVFVVDGVRDAVGVVVLTGVTDAMGDPDTVGFAPDNNQLWLGMVARSTPLSCQVSRHSSLAVTPVAGTGMADNEPAASAQHAPTQVDASGLRDKTRPAATESAEEMTHPDAPFTVVYTPNRVAEPRVAAPVDGVFTPTTPSAEMVKNVPVGPCTLPYCRENVFCPPMFAHCTGGAITNDD